MQNVVADLEESPKDVIKMLQQGMLKKELQLEQILDGQKKVKEELAIKEQQTKDLKETLDSVTAVSSAKDIHIAKLSQQIKEQQPGYSQSENVKKLLEASQAHQAQNNFLSQELRLFEERFKAVARIKQQTNQLLQTELNFVRQNYYKLRFEILDKNPNKFFTEEYEELHRELFYSLAMTIKLNLVLQGKVVEKDVASLYQDVKAQKVDYRVWNSWLYESFRYDPNNVKKIII